MSKHDPEFLKELDIENYLDGDVKMIANRIGFETLVKLWECFGGMHLYVSERPIWHAKRAYIVEHYDGSNVKELARKCRVSVAYVYQTIKAHRDKKRKKNKD